MVASLVFQERGGFSTEENELHPQSTTSKENQSNNEICPQSQRFEHSVNSHIQDTTPQRDSGNDSPYTKGLIPLRERGWILLL